MPTKFQQETLKSRFVQAKVLVGTWWAFYALQNKLFYMCENFNIFSTLIWQIY